MGTETKFRKVESIELLILEKCNVRLAAVSTLMHITNY